MLKNYIKVAFRNLLRQKGYAFINITGLAIGLACSFFILLWVQEELGYDRHHPDHERVYRVAEDIVTPTANRIFAEGPAPLAPALLENYPQVEEAVRLLKGENVFVTRGPDRRFYESNFFYADPSIFNIFALNLAYGNAGTALEQPETVVISAHMAAKYFDEENPVGQTLTIYETDYEVTGVLQETRHNSHITFDFISSILPLEQRYASWFQNWLNTEFYTYVKMNANADVAQFDHELSQIAENYVGDFLRENQGQLRFFLQPVAQIHLHSQLRGEIEPSGNVLYIYIFSVVAVLILLIASLNYINLTTAQSTARAKEIGVRKVVGSGRHQLIWQFFSESVVLTMAALALAVILATLAFPWFHDFTGYRMDPGKIMQPKVLAGMIGILVLTGGLSGFFPAFVLSSMHPLHVLTGRFRSSGRGVLLRKVLVTGQFTISLILIVGSVTVFQQLEFMKQTGLGFDKEQILVLPTRGLPVAERYELIKAEWLRDPAIHAATASSSVPGRGVLNFAVELLDEDDPKGQSMYYLFVDFDFISTYDIEIIAGRALQENFATDRENAFLMNEAGLHAFGWQTPEEALGKRVQTGFLRTGEIVGVYRNFNYRSLHAGVEPLMLAVAPSRFGYFSLKIGTDDLSSALARVEQTWRQLFPGRPFEYFFLDEDFNRQYRSDENTALLMLVFTGLAILIACLGLLGLAAFTARQRTKEIGVRKVLGATVANIVGLLSKDFLKLVLLGSIIAIPIAWVIMNRWLEDFAYRIDIGPGVFLLTGLAVVLIALATVSWQSVKAALMNPVEALRSE